MIVFSGKLNAACVDYILKKEVKIGRISILIVWSVFCIPLVWLAVFYHPIFALAFVVPVLMLLLTFKRPSQKDCGKIIPKTIVIQEDGKMTAEGEDFFCTAETENIKKVVDYGEWYQIFFVFPYRNFRFICQKSLLTQGTIEEFEEMFKEQLVRK